MCLTPLMSYSNLDTLKLSILNDNKLKAGIYRITNNITGESYVGSSVNISQRFKSYFNINYISRGAKSSLSAELCLNIVIPNLQPPSPFFPAPPA